MRSFYRNECDVLLPSKKVLQQGMHDNERAIPRVDVARVDCPGGIALGVQKRDEHKEMRLI
jgi:hypothetical protein